MFGSFVLVKMRLPLVFHRILKAVAARDRSHGSAELLETCTVTALTMARFQRERLATTLRAALNRSIAGGAVRCVAYALGTWTRSSDFAEKTPPFRRHSKNA